MNILFTNANDYLDVHEAFRLDYLDSLAQKYGFIIFANVNRSSTRDYSAMNLKHTYFSSKATSTDNLQKELIEVVNKYKPKKIMNNLEYYLPWFIVKDIDVEKIYFVRSCVNKLRSVAYKPLYDDQVDRESQYLAMSDRIVTDSPNSVFAIKEMYPQYADQDISLILEYVNPKKYLDLPIASNISKDVYSIGRADYQKGLYNIKDGVNYSVNHIGDRVVDDDISISPSANILGMMGFEEYKSIVQPMNYGLFPSVWESNGYTVQEAFAMGKIPIIQRGSGGNERHANVDNSLVIDFKTDHWEDAINDNLHRVAEMQEAAKDTITQQMYDNSLEKMVEVLCT